MGLLTEGEPLSWEETKKLADHVRQHGIIQFINQYHRLKTRSKDCLMWGDEVEYVLVSLDHETKKARLLLKAKELLDILMEQEHNETEHIALWRPEYATYMVEGTPGKPYGHSMAHFNLVEANMKHRRESVGRLLTGPNEMAMTLTSFFRLGCSDSTVPFTKPNPLESASKSLFVADEITFQGHPRFRTLTRNIRERRGEKVAINIPIYKDVNTPEVFVEDFSTLGAGEGDSAANASAALPDHIYMDAMGFGMGCCCLQMTFQACNIDEARLLYDQLTPMCPILMALTAASPVHRGLLADTDCRWNVIASSVDDRTREERGLDPLKNNRFVIPKSRYDSIDSYLSASNERYNDIQSVIDEDICKQLCSAGIDPLLAKHVAHLFIRDPISLFKEKIDQDDSVDTDHFENIQSTNWQTMRFKPPPPGTDIGWRVEFRPMEVQLTDFENAAYVVFMVLLTRVILSFNLNFVIPISKVDENIKTAQKRDAVLNEKFYFRKNPMTCHTSPKIVESCCANQQFLKCECMEDEYGLFTVQEIVCGKPGEFAGLLPLIEQYAQSVDCDVDTCCTISQYLKLIRQRASGKLKTMARWTRDFIDSHPEYAKDSVVSERICYDLVSTCAGVTSGTLDEPTLVFSHKTRSAPTLPSALQRNEQHLKDMVAKHGALDGIVNRDAGSGDGCC